MVFPCRECEENNTALYSAANLGSILTGVGLQGWAGSVEASILQLFNLTEVCQYCLALELVATLEQHVHT